MTAALALLLLPAVFLLGSCGIAGNDTASATTTTTTTVTTTPAQLAAAELEADRPLVKALFRNASDAWHTSVEAARVFYRDNNYPGSGITLEACEAKGPYPEGTSEEFVVDEASIERDDGWKVPDGAMAGQVPAGRIYIVKVTTTMSHPHRPPEARTSELHVAVLDGRAYFFVGC